MRVLVMVPMKSELAPFVRLAGLTMRGTGREETHVGQVGNVEVIAVRTGMGPPAARSATDGAVFRHSPDHVVVMGIAGGVDPGLALGEIVVPERVIDIDSGSEHLPSPMVGSVARGTLATSERLITDGPSVAGLIADGVTAIDMETAAVGAVCEAAGIPWSVFRSISDKVQAGTVDDEVFALANPDGSPRIGASIRYVVTHPGQMPRLRELARGGRLATRAAARATYEALSKL